MITGSASYQELFQGLLAERVFAGGEESLVPVMKLTGDSQISVTQINALVPTSYDYVSLSYTGDNLTQAVFKQGGAGGVTVATLNMTYSGSNLLTVTKT